jgi:hypothetical protein
MHMRGIIFRKPATQKCVAALSLALASLLWTAPAVAQKQQPGNQGNPQLMIVSPSGGKAGTAVELTVSGQDLDEPQSLLFSYPGIRAERAVSAGPATPDPNKNEPKKGQAKRAPNASITAVHHFKVTIPADTPLGTQDVRIVTARGVSNPRAFVVSDMTEVLEKEPNNDLPEAQRVELNTTINGAIATPTDVDYFIFSGKKGQRVVTSCLASSIDSRLQPGLEVYDRAGKLLGFNKNYNGNDALVDVTLPEDGDYFVRLYEFTYTLGGPEYFYRLTISTAPWIDAVYPPMVQPGKPTEITVLGRNLPGGKADPTAVVDGRALETLSVIVTAPDSPVVLQRLAYQSHILPNASSLDGFEYRLRNESGTSNPFLLTYARAPIVLDNGANDTPETAQELTLPCEVAGRIEKKGDRDWYTFTAKKDDVYSIELFGDRLGSPIDLYFTLRDAGSKKVLADLDDNPDVLNPIQFFTRSDDPPRYRFVVPADGRYQLLVASREAFVQSGPRDFYRLRITPEEPDFRLVLMPQANMAPEACIVQPGGRQYYTVYVWRLDDFAGEITLTADGLPPGVTCPPQTIGPGVRQATLVLAADSEAKPWAGALTIKGTATINGKTVVREARAASITWPTPQQNVAAISRLDHNLVFAVRADKTPFQLEAGFETTKASPGDKVTIPLKVIRQSADFKLPIQVTVLNSPTEVRTRGNRQQQGLTIAPGKDEASVVLDLRPDVAPGNYTLVLRGEAQATPAKGNRPRTNTSLVQTSAPIALTVLPKHLATIALAPDNPSVKAGQETEVVVKLTRMNNFKGKFRIQLVLPPKVKGITAEEATVPADKDEVKVVLKVSKDAAIGQRPDLIMRVTGTGRDGTTVSQEAKFSLNVVK